MIDRTTALHDARAERDACGFALIANLDGIASRRLVVEALDALDRMTHRGAVGADGRSGDGCGILAAIPHDFFRARAREAGFEPAARFAVGNVFLPHDPALATRCRERLGAELAAAGLAVAGWREPPLDLSACGEIADRNRPLILQCYVDAPDALDADGFERALYRARRRAEIALVEVPEFCVVTLSATSIGYKAMVLPDALPAFYRDLADPAFESDAAIVHQRFSTNTAPAWRRAQPFRMLAHNGEINTAPGNRRWTEARAVKWRSPHLDYSDLLPICVPGGSDSESLDNVLEALVMGGMALIQAMRILIPPPTAPLEFADPDLAAFYEYYALNQDLWDGPAAVAMFDARYAACTLDRNGLRPARWVLTSANELKVASEVGVFAHASADEVRKGKLGPGEMIAVDRLNHRFLDSAAIDAINRDRAPFKRWLRAGVRHLDANLIDPSLAAEPFPPDTLARFQKLYGLTREEREEVLRVLAETEQEAVGSMGDDTPIAVLSEQPRALYDCFRQGFAQVTNPPIDPLREQIVMSLATQFGREGNLFEVSAQAAQQVIVNSPVLSQRKLRQLLKLPEFRDANALVHLFFDPATETLAAALARICEEVAAKVSAGAILVVLSDRYPVRGRLPVHALLAVGAVHADLIRRGLRCDCNLVVETGTARDPHHFACLIGFGATAVYPYLAYQTLFDLGRRDVLKGKRGNERAELGRSYRRGIKKGLLKIISKLGISTISSYRGAGLFEIVGLDRDVVERCFPGTPGRIGGTGFEALEAEARRAHDLAWNEATTIAQGGLYRYVAGGEYHMYNPDVIASLQRSVRTGDYEDYATYARHVDGRPPSTLRDHLALRLAATPLPIDSVEPPEAILRRFDSAGMSLGALSPEAHEALAIAMNRLGGRSNSGEGGEDPARHGTEKRSKIKQVASGRFGVTPEYLVNAEVLQIKIAQGAKPGEGGQLPGHKVNELIARLRFAKPGIGLISPPPHHDIYSIEDLAQLIYDLKEVNPDALVSVKLVSHAGIGTVATGVVKAYADLITVSGHDGGTGASPLSSIKYAGTPWELGLSEVQQALRENDLRHRVRVQVDGGLKTGLDVVKAAILGAESFGFGTAPMVALGCKYLRICHLNNCATGVATQDQRLRSAHFTGLPEMAMNYFRFVAEDVRGWLARLGVARLEDLVGRIDLLEPIAARSPRARHLDLSPILAAADGTGPAARTCAAPRNPPRDPGDLAERIQREVEPLIAAARGGEFRYEIRNHDRSVGARVSGALARRHGGKANVEGPIVLRFRGHAGQSFGCWNAGGLVLELEGEANDYVGKGMAGGRIVVRPFAESRLVARETPIVGNTCLYGATGGEFYAAGRAGERFAVRNSGATAVVEGAGDHCCEYMTGGTVLVLGRCGWNFGAGFTGGFAYVLDEHRDFVDRYNHELIDISRIDPESMERHVQHLRRLVEAHVAATGSAFGATLLEDFRDWLGRFWLVKPKAASLDSLVAALKRAA
jgi:glutamate synthase (NADPH/NADH) large chain